MLGWERQSDALSGAIHPGAGVAGSSALARVVMQQQEASRGGSAVSTNPLYPTQYPAHGTMSSMPTSPQLPRGTGEVQLHVRGGNGDLVHSPLLQASTSGAAGSAGAILEPRKSFGRRAYDFARVAMSEFPLAERQRIVREAARKEELRLEVAGKKKGSKWSLVAGMLSDESREAANQHVSAKGQSLLAILSLQREVQDNPRRKRMYDALERKRLGEHKSLLDRLADEVLISCERMFDFFTPAESGRHLMWYTFFFTMSCITVFFFMAAEYPFWLSRENPAVTSDGTCVVLVNTETFDDGPDMMIRWMTNRDYGGKDRWRVFDSRFLNEWGGRVGPALRAGKWYRWLTSTFIHTSFSHLASNTLLFISLAAHLEQKYGVARIASLCLISGVGGNLFSALFEDPCTLVAGASGSCFGIFGLFVADICLNFETVTRPLLRILLASAFLINFLVTVITVDSATTSHWSHLGGLLCGLFPAFLFLPNFKSERWEAALPVLGLLTLLVVFIVFPIVVYKGLDDMCCADWGDVRAENGTCIEKNTDFVQDSCELARERGGNIGTIWVQDGS
mmetsp:Transcript_1755/g.6118  ORF Transcript_1755/g.6118 Transcript_1755/m.6118 type:complete len:565 (-) Transcript_1755:161-1855(-)